MTKSRFFEIIKVNKVNLRKLIKDYHPVNLPSHADTDSMSPDITAPQAERACEQMRQQIKVTSFDYPEVLFDIAITKQDTESIYVLLEQTWIGVPESHFCWQIPGFNTMVDLLDDPIEE